MTDLPLDEQIRDYVPPPIPPVQRSGGARRQELEISIKPVLDRESTDRVVRQFGDAIGSVIRGALDRELDLLRERVAASGGWEVIATGGRVEPGTPDKVNPRALGGVREIAVLCNVSTSNVSQWITRRSVTRFPEPVVTLRMGAIFNLDEVAHWHTQWIATRKP